MRLSKAGAEELAVAHVEYSVTGALPRGPDPQPIQEGIPRLELWYADGRVEGWDFVGELREPGRPPRSTSEAVPSDLTRVESFLAHAPIGPDVVSHRITLDARTLSEVKRPPEPPSLSAIECDDTRSDGVRLSWRARDDDPNVPLLLDVMHHDGRGFVALLPRTDARATDGLTLSPSDLAPEGDLVLQVSVTDTFQVVSRAVLVPKHAL
jgi:hypothetical protein